MFNKILVLSFLTVIAAACSNSQAARITDTATAYPTISDLARTNLQAPTSTVERASPTQIPATPESEISHGPISKPSETSTPTLDPMLVSVLTATPDYRHAATRTPAPSRRCPEGAINGTPEIPQALTDLGEWPPDAILRYLNTGGDPSYLQSSLKLPDNEFAQIDVTGDGVAEVLIRNARFNIFICAGGVYEHVVRIAPYNPGIAPWITAIEDLNLDGILEVVIEDFIFSAGINLYYIYEWNGDEFELLTWPSEDLFAYHFTTKGRSLTWYERWVPSGSPEIISMGSGEIRDLDGDGVKEFVVHNQIPPPRHRQDGPWRETMDTYRWNGRIYIWDQLEIDPPVYRFQAIQDGDRMSLLREHEKALELYQQAISSDHLAAWSFDNYIAQLRADYELPMTPTSIPFIQEEYDHLAAYAYYRIMLLHVLEGDFDAARIAYDTLSEKYPNGNAGHAYVEMAGAFWRGYTPGANIGDGCYEVIQYAEKNKSSLFIHLGGNPDNFFSHGGQNHIYTPWDMCPFE